MLFHFPFPLCPSFAFSPLLVLLLFVAIFQLLLNIFFCEYASVIPFSVLSKLFNGFLRFSGFPLCFPAPSSALLPPPFLSPGHVHSYPLLCLVTYEALNHLFAHPLDPVLISPPSGEIIDLPSAYLFSWLCYLFTFWLCPWVSLPSLRSFSPPHSHSLFTLLFPSALRSLVSLPSPPW